MTATGLPTLVAASETDAVHNGLPTRWRIYSEPRGVPFSYAVTTPGGTVHGSAATELIARARIDDYYRMTAYEPEAARC